jgi:hypothetical protein
MAHDPTRTTMTRYTNAGRKRSYLEAGFDDDTNAPESSSKKTLADEPKQLQREATGKRKQDRAKWAKGMHRFHPTCWLYELDGARMF